VCAQAWHSEPPRAPTWGCSPSWWGCASGIWASATSCTIHRPCLSVMPIPLLAFRSIRSSPTAQGGKPGVAPFHAAFLSTEETGPEGKVVRPLYNAKFIFDLAKGERQVLAGTNLLSKRLARSKEVHLGHILSFDHPYLHDALRCQNVF